MIDYDSFSRCHLTDIFFRFSRRSKRVKIEKMNFLDFSCRCFLLRKRRDRFSRLATWATAQGAMI